MDAAVTCFLSRTLRGSHPRLGLNKNLDSAAVRERRHSAKSCRSPGADPEPCDGVLQVLIFRNFRMECFALPLRERQLESPCHR